MNKAYWIFNFVMVAVLIFGITFILQAGKASAGTLPQVVGIDTSVDSQGLAIVNYNGQIYHLAEGDKLAGITVIYIANKANEVLIEQNHHVKEIHFTKAS